jgi:hypothetical protein
MGWGGARICITCASFLNHPEVGNKSLFLRILWICNPLGCSKRLRKKCQAIRQFGRNAEKGRINLLTAGGAKFGLPECAARD